MAVNLVTRVNIGSEIAYGASGANYIDLDLSLGRDYLIWTGRNDKGVADGEDEPTETELNASSPVIQTTDELVPYYLLYDYSAGLLREISGMGENKRFVYCFSFDGDTATEPTLEAWDDDTHNTVDKHVLGGISGYDSFVKAFCSTTLTPSVDWVGTALQGSGSVLGLNDGDPIDMSGVPSGETYNTYANIKIVIPANYGTSGAETFVLTTRYSYM